MVYTNAERQRRYRERKKASGEYEDLKYQRVQQMRRHRKARKEIETTLPIYQQRRILKTRRENIRYRVMKHRLRKQGKIDSPKKKSPFKSAMAYAKATSRVKRALPETPRRRKIICKKLYEMYESDSMHPTKDTRSRSSAISADTIKLVTEFYCRDDISRQAPGRKDTITISDENGQKLHMQVRHLTCSIIEIYRLFREEHPDVDIGKSKFAELRPKHVLLSCKLPHNVCLCKYHDSFVDAISSLHKANSDCPAYSQTFPKSLYCDQPNVACWLNKCKECKHGKGFSDKYSDKLQPIVLAQWAMWKVIKKILIKVREEGTVKEPPEYITNLILQFLEHCYFKRNHSASYQNSASMQKQCRLITTNVLRSSRWIFRQLYILFPG